MAFDDQSHQPPESLVLSIFLVEFLIEALGLGAVIGGLGRSLRFLLGTLIPTIIFGFGWVGSSGR